MRVSELVPGMQFTHVPMFGDKPVTFITQCPHPLYHGLQMVIWKMPDGSWSHDALRSDQVLPAGEVIPSNHGERYTNLRMAILGR
jgi:hypothetical protein